MRERVERADKIATAKEAAAHLASAFVGAWCTMTTEQRHARAPLVFRRLPRFGRRRRLGWLVGRSRLWLGDWLEARLRHQRIAARSCHDLRLRIEQLHQCGTSFDLSHATRQRRATTRRQHHPVIHLQQVALAAVDNALAVWTKLRNPQRQLLKRILGRSLRRCLRRSMRTQHQHRNKSCLGHSSPPTPTGRPPFFATMTVDALGRQRFVSDDGGSIFRF